MQLPLPGEVFEGKYKIHEVIGRGGFATVYRATDSEVGRDVALKILSPRDGGYPETVVARFLREARLLAGLQDPHTITMFDFGRTDGGLLFMVFEYVSGLDLAELIKRRGALPAKQVHHILKQVLYALREAHGAGVFHRDIKPPNLLIYAYMGDESCVKLLDFGVAKPVDADLGGPANLTKKGALVGTPRYMAPEQIFGHELSASADLYSLGLVAYEMLTGRPAMDARTNKDRVRQQLSDTPTVVPEDVGTPALRSVINRMALKEPAARYQSADEALVALRSGKVEKPVQHTSSGRDGGRAAATVGDETMPPVLTPNLRRIILIGALTAASGLLVVWVGSSWLRASRAQVVEIGETVSDETTTAIERVVTSTAPAADSDSPAKAAATGSGGCGAAFDPSAVGVRSREVLIGLRQRPWLQYVPRGYNPDTRYPVMLMFHNMFSDPRKFMSGTKMAPLADDEGIVLIAPAAEGADAWQDADNFELVTRALEQTRRELCIDDSRIYAIGHGRGGWFARDLGCYMPLSAIAVTGAGQRTGDSACQPIPAVPLIRLYGNADPLIPVAGGPGCLGGDYLSAREIDDQWRKRYECEPTPRPWFRHDHGECRTWSCQGEHARYVSCQLAGGHDWPEALASPTTPNCQSVPADFPYRDTIWRFLATQGRTL